MHFKESFTCNQVKHPTSELKNFKKGKIKKLFDAFQVTKIHASYLIVIHGSKPKLSLAVIIYILLKNEFSNSLIHELSAAKCH